MPDDDSLWWPAKAIATWFGVGLLPKAPGTWGSLAALPFAWLIAAYAGQLWLLAASAVLIAIGTAAAQAYGRAKGVADAPEIVVDEVAGQWLTLTVVPPDLLLYAIGFVLFRIADIAKPWPANLVDRRLKNGFGVMLDDMVVAVYASGTLLVGLLVFGE